MPEGRGLVFPQAVAFGARPLDVPGRGAVLCASLVYVFRLSTGEHVRPAQWYEAVAAFGGREAIPDSMSPLPGAEVVVLGALPPVAEATRAGYVRCGGVERRFVLHRDPDHPDAPLLAGPPAACWHEEDNPAGRGGPDDARPPLIVDEREPDRPVWLGATPYHHPVRLRRMGVPDERSGAGWPADADPSALYDAHPAFWTDALDPGQPLEYEGLAARALETSLPPYRASITSWRNDVRWISETTRIHSVMLIPGADLGAVFWRAGIDLGDDILGESVVGLLAALEDADAPVRDPEHWGGIMLDRWTDPVTATDDRPLLPAALAATVALPFQSFPDGLPMNERVDAAEAWMREEAGLPDENPFADRAPEEATRLTEEADRLTGPAQADAPDGMPDADRLDEMASAAFALGRRRREEAGFELPPDPGEDEGSEPRREPEVRGATLEAEIESRLAGPHAAESEVAIARHLAAAGSGFLDPDEVLERLAETRLQSPSPPLPWPAFHEDEGTRFGERVGECLAAGALARHVDISGAVVDGGPAQRRVSGLRQEGLLAEEAVWRGVRFWDCELTASSFAGGRFEGCEFRGCTFDRVNLSRATLDGTRFEDCTFRDIRMVGPVWMDCRFDRCRFERVHWTDAMVRDLEFSGGEWREVLWSEGVLIRVALRGTPMREVTFVNTHAPNSRFEGLSMFKVWVMGLGFPGSVFEEVDAATCGFVSTCRFDEARFERTRFTETGFTNAVFKDARFAPGCRFDACDLSGAVFENVDLSGVRFLRCTMATSAWTNARAAGTWFFGSILRGVDFGDTELAGAVFTDADVKGAKFQPDRTIGADFRGALGAPG